MHEGKIYLPQPMVHNVQPSQFLIALSLQLTLVLSVTCFHAVLWPELWLLWQSDSHH